MSFIDLSGVWHAIPDNTNCEGVYCKWAEKGLPSRMYIPRVEGLQPDIMMLPGTTDEAHIGYPFTPSPTMSLGLDRAYDWDKDVWLDKTIEIPESCAGKEITLVFERTFHQSWLWVDGESFGTDKSCATPHRYDVTHAMTPGTHRITLRINALDPEGFGGHHILPGSGAKYNGILGYIGLLVREPAHLENLQCYPDPEHDAVKIRAQAVGVTLERNDSARVTILDENGNSVAEGQGEFQQGEEGMELTAEVPMKDYQQWSEFHPVLYTAAVRLLDENKAQIGETISTRFGMVRYGTRGTNITVNGIVTFLRGTHEGCQFPLQGGPTMDKAEWLHMFGVARKYGMNHLRFHSWCPPEACFAAADELGFYLQVEMSGGHSTELPRILDTFGSHPSFMSLTLGNELFNHNEGEENEQFLSRRWGNNDSARKVSSKQMLRTAQHYDPRHLYSCTSHPVAPEPCVDDYYVSAWGRNGVPTVGIQWAGGDVQHVTRFNTHCPDTTFDYSKALEGMEKPIISHEVGQWLVYPNLNECGKYTGVLRNHNYDLIRERLRKNFLLDKSHLFTLASGKLSVLLYKEEIESALRTRGFGGFALLDLRDYPGQGIATIGILDAFWDSKGTVTEERFQQFCDPETVLLRMPKRNYDREETLKATLEFANYTEQTIHPDRISVTITDEKTGETVRSLDLKPVELSQGTVTEIAEFSLELNGLQAPGCYRIQASVGCGVHVRCNSWKFWLFEHLETVPVPENVIVADHLDDALLEKLRQGASVILNVYHENLSDARPGCFTSEFWTPHNKPVPPAKTLGLYIDTKSPVFADYPTDFHSDWQWWDAVMHSKAIVIDDLSYNLNPLVGVIDNFDTNNRLASLLECRIGRGKLLINAFDLEVDAPSVRQLKKAIYEYVSGENFKPATEVTEKMLRRALTNRDDLCTDYHYQY